MMGGSEPHQGLCRRWPEAKKHVDQKGFCIYIFTPTLSLDEIEAGTRIFKGGRRVGPQKYLSREQQRRQTNKRLRAVICSNEQQAACLESQKECNAELRTNSGSAGTVG
jgi:hypothetical protein